MSRAKNGTRYDKWGYAFVAPFVLAFLVFQLYPVCYTFFLGFTDMKGTSKGFSFVGISNFVNSTKSINMDGLTASDANRYAAALDATGFTAETNAPTPVDSAFSSDAPADPYSLGAKDAGTGAVYRLRLTRLSDADMKKVSAALESEGLDAGSLSSTTSTAMGGLLYDGAFWKAFGNTWIIWLGNFVPQIGFALLFAVWFTDIRLKLKLTGFLKTVFYLPNIITAASVAVLFSTLFAWPSGPVNQFLVQVTGLGESVNFYRSGAWTRGITSFILFWMWFGSTLIVLVAGIVGIPESLFESAVVDGANSRQIFLGVTLPLLKPVMAYTLITSLIGGMQMFDIPFLLTNRRGDPDGSINTMAMYLYNHAFSSSNNYSYASAVSIGMFAMILVLAMTIYFLMRDTDETAMPKGGKR